MDCLRLNARRPVSVCEAVATCPLALGERAGVRGYRFRHFLSIRLIDAAVAETAFQRLQVVGELTLDPFEIGQTRTIGELVQHPCGDQIGHVLLWLHIFASRTHRHLPLVR